MSWQSIETVDFFNFFIIIVFIAIFFLINKHNKPLRASEPYFFLQ